MEIVWFAGFCAVMVAMWWFAYRMDPHYSSRDGTRFLCNAQELADGQVIGRMRETRVTVMPDGVLLVSQKRALRRTSNRWALIGKSPDPPRGKQVYLVQQFEDGKWLHEQLALQLPQRSRSVPVLDEAMTRRGVTP